MVGNLKEIQSGRSSRTQKMILKWKIIRECGLASSGSGQEPVASPSEHGNELLVFTKYAELHE
jgi:hypothetical protein